MLVKDIKTKAVKHNVSLMNVQYRSAVYLIHMPSAFTISIVNDGKLIY